MFESILLILLLSVLYAAISGAPFVPVSRKGVDIMLDAARLQEHEIAFDLGAGVGSFIVAAKKKLHKHIYGIELGFPVWLIGIVNLLGHQISPKYLKFGNLFNLNFSDIDVIFCFLLPPAMEKLRDKIQAEARPGTRIISYAFPLPDYTPDRTIENPQLAPIYVYSV